MSILRRLFGPEADPEPVHPGSDDGHFHAPDAHPDDVVLPKQKRSSRSLIAGKPPLGWKRSIVEDSGGFWPWSGGGGDFDSGGGGFDAGGGFDGGGDGY